MYKNQLQELAQRSCFNLPSYTCIREGPDHAPRFKATVNFNGEVFESHNYCSTLRQAEHSAAEVALTSLSTHSLAARILDETGVYKNLLQEVSQRVGAPLPVYHSFRSGLGHLPVFTGTVELAGVTFTGEPAKNKKQAEKNAAMAAWASLKQLAKEVMNMSNDPENPDELEHVTVAKALLNYRRNERISAARSFRAPSLFPEHLLVKPTQPSSLPKPPPAASSKILPLICRRTETPQSAEGQPSSQPQLPTTPRAMSPHGERRRARRNARSTAMSMSSTNVNASVKSTQPDSFGRPPSPQPFAPTTTQTQSPEKSWRFPVMSAAPYVPFSKMRMPYQSMAPSVTVRSAIPVFSARPLQSPGMASHVIRAAHQQIPPPVAFPHVTPSVRIEFPPSLKKENPPARKIEASLTLKHEDSMTPKTENLQLAQTEEDPPNPKNKDASDAHQNDLDRIISLLPEEFLTSPQIEHSTTSALELLHINK